MEAADRNRNTGISQVENLLQKKGMLFDCIWYFSEKVSWVRLESPPAAVQHQDSYYRKIKDQEMLTFSPVRVICCQSTTPGASEQVR